MENVEVRMELIRNGIKHYQLAAYLGISSCTLSRWLRLPLDEEHEKVIGDAIQSLANRG